MEIQERLEIFYARLRTAPACATAEEALALVCRLIEEVEDEFCSIPRQHPPSLSFTGRMYAPHSDHVFPSPDGAILAETRRHTMHLSPDGAMHIFRFDTNDLEFSKSGITV